MGSSTSKRKATRSDEARIRTGDRKELSVGELERALEIELRHVRALLREVAANYVLRLEADIERVVEAIGDNEGRKKRDAQAGQAELRDVLDRLRTLKVKPGKGRRRDVKRMDKLIGELVKWADRWMEER